MLKFTPKSLLALFVAPNVQLTHAIHKEVFTTNAVCSARNCINPVFPGLEAINTLSSQKFSCQELSDAQPSLSFCSGAVDYNPSLPFMDGSTKTVAQLVGEQEQKAMTTYFLHLSAMGMEPWDYQEPQNGDDSCIQSIWRLACYTYFPKTPRNCAKDQESSYIRPCASSCANYVNQCRVECCDESVQCSFEHSSKVGENTITTFGFSPHEGPSMFCTGSANGRSVITALGLTLMANFLNNFHFSNLLSPRLRSLGVVLFMSGIALNSVWSTEVHAINLNSNNNMEKLNLNTQTVKSESHNHNGKINLSHSNKKSGTSAAPFSPIKHVISALQTNKSKSKITAAMATKATTSSSKSSTANIDFTGAHSVGSWRRKEDYLIKYQYIPPGSTSANAVLNSCSLPQLAQTLQCNGRGMCKTFNPYDIANQVFFCQCERDYADPECRTKRKSQVTAYLLSMFLGIFGVDRFYLGFPISGAMKLVSLGGFGFWWIADIVYIGSAPVYADNFRVSANLPHWVFVATTVTISIIIGFVVSFWSTSRSLNQKRKAAFLYHAEGGASGGDGLDFETQQFGFHAKKAPQPQVSFPPIQRE